MAGLPQEGYPYQGEDNHLLPSTTPQNYPYQGGYGRPYYANTVPQGSPFPNRYNQAPLAPWQDPQNPLYPYYHPDPGYSGLDLGPISSTAYPDWMPDSAQQYQPIELSTSHDDEHGANKNRSRLMRAQWDDYQRRFMPIEDDLIDQLGNPEYYGTQASQASDLAGSAYDTQQGMYDRNMARYGIAVDPEQQQHMNTQMGLDKAAAQTQAANQTRDELASRDRAIMGGGIVPEDPRKRKQ